MVLPSVSDVTALLGGVTLAAGNVDIFTVAIDVDPVNPNDDKGEEPLRKKIKSDDVSTCLIVAPALCAIPETPAVPVPA